MTRTTGRGGANGTRSTIAVAMPWPARDGVAEALEEAGFAAIVVDEPADLASVLQPGTEIAVAIVDTGQGAAAAVTAVQAAMAGYGQSIPVVYVAGDAELDVLSAGMGPNDEILLHPVTPDGLRWRLEAMNVRAQVSPAGDEGAVFATGHVNADWLSHTPILAVFNPKGGVGKTTIATSLAAVLQLRRQREVLLVDADTVTGHVSLSLGVNPGPSLSEQLGDEADGAPSRSLLDLATTHSSGVRLVTLTNNPLSLDHLEAERVTEAILAARHGVGAIIVDMHPSYSELNLAIFAIADHILVPVTPDLPAMLAAVRLKEVTSLLGVGDRLALVVNRANSGVPVSDIEQTLGLKAVGQIPSAGLAFVRSANAGRSVIEKFPDHQVCRDLERLADGLLATSASSDAVTRERDPRSLLRSLLGRRLPAHA